MLGTARLNARRVDAMLMSNHAVGACLVGEVVMLTVEAPRLERQELLIALDVVGLRPLLLAVVGCRLLSHASRNDLRK